MARPLTKTKTGGELYTRPPDVDAQIDEAICLSRSDLQTSLLITDRNALGYLRTECLVHLVRQGRRCDDQRLMNTVLPVLLGRCEANLLVTVPDGEMPDASSLRQEILDTVTDLFVTDGTGDFPDELDFYECRFNRAFQTRRIDMVRRDIRRRKRSIAVVDLPPSESPNEPDDNEDAFARVSDAYKSQPTQEWDAFREPIEKAIKALPADERDAIILVHVLGYKEESEDPKEETAATRCNCTGRTIRNRLNRAAAKLSRFKEVL